MLRAILHGDPVPVDGEAAIQTLELISKAYNSATWLDQTWIPSEEKAVSRMKHWRASA
jgi:hypothetical protein